MHLIILGITTILALVVLSQLTEGFSIFSSGAKWNLGPRPPNVVSFYQDTQFRGMRRDFPLGAVQNSLSKGFWGMSFLSKENDTYSSVQVPAGMKVLAYTDNDFRGMGREYGPGDYSNLGDFNDKISSLKVVASTNAATSMPVAIFYEHKDFKGKQLRIYGTDEVPYLANMSGIDSRDKMISSVSIAAGYKVLIYKQPNFVGEQGTWTAGNYAYVGDYWNDSISSLKVVIA